MGEVAEVVGGQGREAAAIGSKQWISFLSSFRRGRGGGGGGGGREGGKVQGWS